VGHNRQTHFHYDDMGRVTHEVKANIKVAEFTSGMSFETRSHVVGITTYDDLGNVIKTQQKTANSADISTLSTKTSDSKVWKYDAVGRLTHTAKSWVSNTTVDKQKSLTDGAIKKQSGRQVTSMGYDVFGNLVSQTEHGVRGVLNIDTLNITAPSAKSNDKTTRHEYNSRGQLIAEYDALGNKTTHYYNSKNLLAKSETAYISHIGSSSPAQTHITTYSYDNNGQLIQKVVDNQPVIGAASADPQFTFNTAYNAFGEVKKDNKGVYVYNAQGQLWKTTQGDGVLKTHTYDNAGRLQSTVHALNGKTQFKRDGLGYVTEVTQPTFTQNGVLYTPIITQKHDRWGNVIEVRDATQNVTKAQYNYQNKVIKEILPSVDVMGENGQLVRRTPENIYHYDENGNLISKIDANENQRRFKFDANGNQIYQQDGEGNLVEYGYDIFGRKVFTQDALKRTTTSMYDKLDRVIEAGQYGTEGIHSGLYRRANTYQYDALGNRYSETNALGGKRFYDFDAMGNITYSRDAEQRLKAYSYNKYGNQTAETYFNVDMDNPGQNAQNTRVFNAFGSQLSGVDLSNRASTYKYSRNWNTELEKVASLDADGKEVFSEKNDIGRLVERTNDYGQDIRYTYYENGWLKSVLDVKTGAKSEFEYDLSGRRTNEIKRAWDDLEGVIRHETQTRYDSHGRITQVDTLQFKNTSKTTTPEWVKGSDVASVHYTYDAVGNRRSMQVTNGLLEVVEPIVKKDIPAMNNKEGEEVTLHLSKYFHKSIIVDKLIYTAENLPKGLKLDKDTGIITGKLSYNSKPTDRIKVTATDADFAAHTVTSDWVLNIENVEPIEFLVDLNKPLSRNEGEAPNITLPSMFSVKDKALKITQYNATGLPEGLSINKETGKLEGRLKYNTQGKHTIEVTMSTSDIDYKKIWSFELEVINKDAIKAKTPARYEIRVTEGTSLNINGEKNKLFDIFDSSLQFEYSILPPGAGESFPSEYLSINKNTGVISDTIKSNNTANEFNFTVVASAKGDAGATAKQKIKLIVTHREIYNVKEGEQVKIAIGMNDDARPEAGLKPDFKPDQIEWETRIERENGRDHRYLVIMPRLNAAHNGKIAEYAFTVSKPHSNEMETRSTLHTVRVTDVAKVTPPKIAKSIEDQALEVGKSGYDKDFTSYFQDDGTIDLGFAFSVYDDSRKEYVYTQVPSGLRVSGNRLVGTPSPSAGTEGRYKVVVTAYDSMDKSQVTTQEFMVLIKPQGAGSSNRAPYLEVFKVPSEALTKGEEFGVSILGKDIESYGYVQGYEVKLSNGLQFNDGTKAKSFDNNFGDQFYFRVKVLQGGSQQVQVRVQDNSGTWSQWYSKPVGVAGHASPIGDQRSSEGKQVDVNVSGHFDLGTSTTVRYRADNLPTGLSINAQGRITGKLWYNTAGEHVATVTAYDAANSAYNASTTVRFRISNVEPINASSISSFSIYDNQTLNSDAGRYFSVTDASLKLSYRLSGAPSGVSIDSNGIISGPIRGNQGVYRIAVTASAKGAQVDRSFTMTINGTGGASVIAGHTKTIDLTNLLSQGERLKIVDGAPSWARLSGTSLVVSPPNSAVKSTPYTVIVEAEGRNELGNPNEFITVAKQKYNFTVVDAPNNAPSIGSIAGTNALDVNGSASFSVSASDSDGQIAQYQWETSGGLSISGSGSRVTVTGLSAGTHTLSVRVKDNDGAWSGTVSKTISVSRANKAPTISSFIGPISVFQGESAVFFVAASDSDAGDSIVAYDWGVSSGLTISKNTGNQITVSTHSLGTKTVTVTVVDKHGARTSQTRNIVVKSRPQPAAPGISLTTHAITLGDNSWYTATAGNVSGATAYRWSSGSGITLSGSGRQINYKATAEGGHTVTVKAYINGVWSKESTAFVNVTKPIPNKAPTASFSIPSSITQGFELDIAASASDSDGTIKRYIWGVPSGLTLVRDSGQNITVRGNSVGTHTITLTVTDDDGASTTISRTLKVAAKAVTNHATNVSGSVHFSGGGYNGGGTVTVSDANGIKAQNVSVFGAPSWVLALREQISATQVRISFSAVAGSGFGFNKTRSGFTFAVNTTDNSGYTASKTMTATVSSGGGGSSIMSFSALSSPTAAFRRVESVRLPRAMMMSAPVAMSLDDAMPLSDAPVARQASSVAQPMLSSAAAQPSSQKPALVKEYWFTYDRNNQVKIDGGTLINGEISTDVRGEVIHYNAAGQQSYIVGAQGAAAQRYLYNSWGQVAQVDTYHNTSGIDFGVAIPGANLSNWKKSSEFSYNAMGQETTKSEYFALTAALGIPKTYKADAVGDGVGEAAKYQVNVGYGGAIKSITTTGYNLAGETDQVQVRGLSQEQVKAKLEVSQAIEYAGKEAAAGNPKN
ncbi:putative Ig domain-containing protein, partial [Pseudoalteromonas sp. MMG013]|uniref:putative Ig domain-containing protein n=1 Tax=Pseudoalteromonas sp. MMG013 TaxID=2822687 RepID=UPI001B398B08